MIDFQTPAKDLIQEIITKIWIQQLKIMQQYLYSLRKLEGIVFLRKRPFNTPGVSQQCKHYLQWKIIREQAFTILHCGELPREAFLGEMVVGQKNTKVIKPLAHERIMRTFAKIADIVGKTCV